MSDLTLDQAQTIVRDALAHARKGKFNALAIVVLDARGSLKASPPASTRRARRWPASRTSTGRISSAASPISPKAVSCQSAAVC